MASLVEDVQRAADWVAQHFLINSDEQLRQRGECWFPRNLSDEEIRLYFVAEAAHTYTPFKIGLLRHRLRWDHELIRVAPFVIRDVIGNPFHPTTCKPAWRTQKVVGLARAIYDERSFERMPDLGDALQGSGCNDADFLSHCRGPGPHVRGCWVIDLVLGKS